MRQLARRVGTAVPDYSYMRRRNISKKYEEEVAGRPIEIDTRDAQEDFTYFNFDYESITPPPTQVRNEHL